MANNENLKEVLAEYYNNCIRTGHYNMRECARYFCKENNHIELDYNMVYGILSEFDKEKSL